MAKNKMRKTVKLPPLLLDTRAMKAVSLFSGCGGSDAGVIAAGFDVVMTNDILAYARDVYLANHAETDYRIGSVAKIETFPDAELLIGCYPCQGFSQGGVRNPAAGINQLYQEFARALRQIRPKAFIVENVSGMVRKNFEHLLKDQLKVFTEAGYRVKMRVLNAVDYGVAQERKRIFIVGVRDDFDLEYNFPLPTHGEGREQPHKTIRQAIGDMPVWPEGEFYAREFHWYYMSRNRKAKWAEPAYTVVANFRHITLHPASPVMTLTWSDLANGWKQRWDFSDQYEHLEADPKRPKLEKARRLSWRECARIQTFSNDFEPVGDTASKFTQIGNAVPPKLAEAIFTHLFSGAGLISADTYLQKAK